MPKKSLLLSASFFDCLGKAAVFCVHKLKVKRKNERPLLPRVWRNRLRGRSPLSLRDISPPGEAFGRADIESSPTEMQRIGVQGIFYASPRICLISAKSAAK